jgi:hypothetical protein
MADDPTTSGSIVPAVPAPAPPTVVPSEDLATEVNDLVSRFGGRKFVLTLVALVLVALSKPLGLDDATRNIILYVALGGVGGTVIDNIATSLGKKGAK